MKNIFVHFHRNGECFELTKDAMDEFAHYHDNYVLIVCNIKKHGNVLRVSTIQCVVRPGLRSLYDENVFESMKIDKEDITRAISLVKYSVSVLFSLIDDTSRWEF